MKYHLSSTKRGQIELPFQLVFALVAGSIILLIFVIFAFKGFRASQEEYSIDVANTLNLLLTSTEISPKTFLPIEDLPLIPLDFSCDGFSVGGQGKSYRNKIVFAPSHLKVSRLFIWSFDWTIPFYVTNMIAVTSPSNIYVFVGREGDPIRDFLKKSIPRNITSLFIPNIQGFVPTGHEQTRFIFVNSPDQSIPANFAGRKVTGLTISGTPDAYTLTFLSLDKSIAQPKQISAVGDALLFGAVFSDNFETYQCNLDKAFTRLRYLARIYDLKQKELAKSPPPGRSCTYNAPLTDLSTTNPQSTKETLEKTMKTNKLLQQQSCPLIY